MPSPDRAASGLPTAKLQPCQATQSPYNTAEAYGPCHRRIVIFPGAQILGEYAPCDLLTERVNWGSPSTLTSGVPEQVHGR